MRFLSLSRPWPWAFTTEELPPLERKLIENRSWMPPISQIGERIALHAAKSWDPDAIGFFLRLGLQTMPGRKELYPSGGVFSVATLERVVTEPRTLPAAQQRWYFGPCGWVFSDLIAMPMLVPCRGAQGLRELPVEPDLAVWMLLLQQSDRPAYAAWRRVMARYQAMFGEAMVPALSQPEAVRSGVASGL